MNDKLQAKHDEDKEVYFQQAIEGFKLQPRDWPPLTEKLHLEIEPFDMIKMVADNWWSGVTIGEAMKEHFREAWDVVWSEMGMDQ